MFDKWMQKSFAVLVGFALLGSGVFFFFEYPGRLVEYADEKSPDSVGKKEDQSTPYSHLQGYDDAVRLQNLFIRNAKKIKPSVVSINSLRQIKRNSGSFHKDRSTWYSHFRDWVEEISTREYEMENLGSGILLDRAGYILTNHHVIEDIGRILVKLNGREYNAKVVGADPTTDLAVLKVFSFKEFPEPSFGKSEDLNVGEWVMAIGNPYGLEGTVTVGIISGKGRTDLGIATYENFLQTDASINPGNSGGPLINLDGQIIGINTAIAELGAGVGFAIPIEMARKIANDLINNGKVERGWIGIGIQPLTEDLAVSFNAPHLKEGVVVNLVNHNTPAVSAGIKQGDIIVQYNGQAVVGTKSFQQLVINTRVGTVIPLKIVRDGSEKTLEVKIGRLEQ